MQSLCYSRGMEKLEYGKFGDTVPAEFEADADLLPFLLDSLLEGLRAYIESQGGEVLPGPVQRIQTYRFDESHAYLWPVVRVIKEEKA